MGRPTYDRPTEEAMKACDIRKGADLSGIETMCYDCRGCSIMYFSLVGTVEVFQDEMPKEETITDWVTGCPPRRDDASQDPNITIYLLLKQYGI